jgi:hypothetical protein
LIPAASRRSMMGLGPSRRQPALLLLVLLAACGDEPKLVFTPFPVVFHHDAEEVLDAVPLDPDHDGDMDIVATTPEGLVYLSYHDGAWTDETAGTALDKQRVATALRVDGLDLLIRRPDATLERLEYSGIGTWTKGGVQPTEFPEAPRAVNVDINLDGRLDLLELEGNVVRAKLLGADYQLHDLTYELGLDALPLRGPGRDVFVLDLDKDGDLDVLAAGGRIMVYLGNGGANPLDS